MVNYFTFDEIDCWIVRVITDVVIEKGWNEMEFKRNWGPRSFPVHWFFFLNDLNII